MNEQRCRQLVNLRALLPLSESEYDSSRTPCEGCGTFYSASFEMHHRQFRSRRGLWVPSNILLLCLECHSGAGGERLWAQTRGWNVHSWEDPQDVPVKVWWSDAMIYLDNEGGYGLDP
jgi:hypothetical protein